MGGPNGATSTENMNGDAKPTNSKVKILMFENIKSWYIKCILQRILKNFNNDM